MQSLQLLHTRSTHTSAAAIIIKTAPECRVRCVRVSGVNQWRTAGVLGLLIMHNFNDAQKPLEHPSTALQLSIPSSHYYNVWCWDRPEQQSTTLRIPLRDLWPLRSGHWCLLSATCWPNSYMVLCLSYLNQVIPKNIGPRHYLLLFIM